MPSLKSAIQHALESNELDAIASLAKKNKRVLPLLVRLAYEKDTLVAWRAIKAVGLIARELVMTDYEFLRETARKLLWSVSDESGGIETARGRVKTGCAEILRFCLFGMTFLLRPSGRFCFLTTRTAGVTANYKVVLD